MSSATPSAPVSEEGFHRYERTEGGENQGEPARTDARSAPPGGTAVGAGHSIRRRRTNMTALTMPTQNPKPRPGTSNSNGTTKSTRANR